MDKKNITLGMEFETLIMDSQRYVPFPPSRVKVKLSRIPKGYPGTRKTLGYIQKLIRQGAKDFYVRQKAIDILLQRRVQPKDYLGEIRALFEWVQQNVRYTRDTFRVEVLHTARRMLELRAGDCDDMTILLGAMLESVGHPIRLVIMGTDPQRPRFFSHIYLEVNHKERWIPLDTTMPFPMGWSSKAKVKEIFGLDREIIKTISTSGLGATNEDIAPLNWLSGLVFDINQRTIIPTDLRVRKLIAILKRMEIYTRDRWLHRFLEYVLRQGLRPGWRIKTTYRLLQFLVRNKLLNKMSANRDLKRIIVLKKQDLKKSHVPVAKTINQWSAGVNHQQEKMNQTRGLGLPPFRRIAISPVKSGRRGFG